MTPTDLYESIVRRIADLSEESLQQLSEYIAFLKWHEEQWREWDDDELRFELGDDEEEPDALPASPSPSSWSPTAWAMRAGTGPFGARHS